jgi:hypothetical protein
MIKIEEENVQIIEVLRENGEKRDKLIEELQKTYEENRKHDKAGQYEEVAKLDEKYKQILEEIDRISGANNQLVEELERNNQEHKRIWLEFKQNDEMVEQFQREFELKLLEEERKKNMYSTCRDQYRHNEPEYYGDGDSD